MLSLAAGFSAIKKDSKLSEADSFGLVGISSTGAILGVLITSLFIGNGKLNGTLPEQKQRMQHYGKFTAQNW